MTPRARFVLSWVLLVISALGFAVTFPLWLADLISDRAMLGITLALSWFALVYEAYNAVQISNQDRIS